MVNYSLKIIGVIARRYGGKLKNNVITFDNVDDMQAACDDLMTADVNCDLDYDDNTITLLNESAFADANTLGPIAMSKTAAKLAVDFKLLESKQALLSFKFNKNTLYQLEKAGFDTTSLTRDGDDCTLAIDIADMHELQQLRNFANKYSAYTLHESYALSNNIQFSDGNYVWLISKAGSTQSDCKIIGANSSNYIGQIFKFKNDNIIELLNESYNMNTDINLAEHGLDTPKKVTQFLTKLDNKGISISKTNAKTDSDVITFDDEASKNAALQLLNESSLTNVKTISIPGNELKVGMYLAYVNGKGICTEISKVLKIEGTAMTSKIVYVDSNISISTVEGERLNDVNVSTIRPGHTFTIVKNTDVIQQFVNESIDATALITSAKSIRNKIMAVLDDNEFDFVENNNGIALQISHGGDYDNLKRQIAELLKRNGLTDYKIELLNESDNLAKVKAEAIKISKENGGCTQHINKDKRGNLYISDWYDSDETIDSVSSMNESSTAIDWSKVKRKQNVKFADLQVNDYTSDGDNTTNEIAKVVYKDSKLVKLQIVAVNPKLYETVSVGAIISIQKPGTKIGNIEVGDGYTLVTNVEELLNINESAVALVGTPFKGGISAKDNAALLRVTLNGGKGFEHFKNIYGNTPVYSNVAGYPAITFKNNDVVMSVPVNIDSVNESGIINNDDEWRDYATTVLKQMHGDAYDQSIADKSIKDLLEKYGDDYGAMIGALTSSIGESTYTHDELLADACEAKGIQKLDESDRISLRDMKAGQYVFWNNARSYKKPFIMAVKVTDNNKLIGINGKEWSLSNAVNDPFTLTDKATFDKLSAEYTNALKSKIVNGDTIIGIEYPHVTKIANGTETTQFGNGVFKVSDIPTITNVKLANNVVRTITVLPKLNESAKPKRGSMFNAKRINESSQFTELLNNTVCTVKFDVQVYKPSGFVLANITSANLMGSFNNHVGNTKEYFNGTTVVWLTKTPIGAYSGTTRVKISISNSDEFIAALSNYMSVNDADVAKLRIAYIEFAKIFEHARMNKSKYVNESAKPKRGAMIAKRINESNDVVESLTNSRNIIDGLIVSVKANKFDYDNAELAQSALARAIKAAKISSLNESDESNAIINTLHKIQLMFEMAHHATPSFSRHKAFDDIKADFVWYKDDLIEKIIGYTGDKYNTINVSPLVNDDSGMSLVTELITLSNILVEWSAANDYKDIENVSQSIHGLSAKLSYLLTLNESKKTTRGSMLAKRK